MPGIPSSPASLPVLTDVATVKAMTGITTSQYDDQITALLPAADAAVKDYCKRAFEVATYTEYLSGTGFRWITLKQRPVISIANLWVDHSAYYGFFNGSFSSTTLLTAGDDYALELDTPGGISTSGRVIRINTVWAEMSRIYVPGRVVQEVGPAFGNIKVEYTAGYSTIPGDLQYAVAMMVNYMRRVIKLGQNVSSEVLGDYGYHLARAGLRDVAELGTTRQTLSRYREPVW